jgi:hypothetical protein
LEKIFYKSLIIPYCTMKALVTKQLGQKLAPVGTALGISALGISALSIVFSPAAHAADLIKQEFSGTFTLSNASPILTGTVPDDSAYSGFVVYEENGALRDWGIDVDKLGLNLSPGSSALGTPAVSFDLLSPSSWGLSVDFGIALDAPRYDVTRADSTLTLDGSVGLAGGYTYQDSAATITQTTTETSVPEPGMILGLIMVGGLGLAARQKELGM